MNAQSFRQYWKDRVPAAFLLLAVLVIWQIAADIIRIPHILPGPSAIIAKTWALRRTLFLVQLPYTFFSVLAGWGMAILFAVLLAVLMSRSSLLEDMIYPVLLVIQTVPVMCIAPLFVLWFGYTASGRILVIVLSTFFGIALNTFDGFREVDRGRMELMESFGAGRLQIFLRLEVPSALPRFLTGLKMTLPWAVVDSAVAEWLGATRGLGYFSKRMVTHMDGPGVFAPILVLCLVTIAGMAVIDLLDRRIAGHRSAL
ncbi:ABC transporter permease [Eubacterium pyruvativorans]|uniref:ABC transporter permease n=1 Tax=Eubacterium pyruvativorans TaxID=155865 RepID=UPI001565645F|nr:ABC transporter permease [Eubacterium pyruvativorans]